MAEAASASTAGLTRGFTSFDELCRAFNLADLSEKSTRQRIDALIAKTHDTITSLELQSQKKSHISVLGKRTLAKR